MLNKFEYQILTTTMKCSKNNLKKLQKNQLHNLAEFVVTENFKHHTGNFSKRYKSDVKDIYKEELSFYDSSEIFTANNHEGTIMGSIRILKWNFIDVLPIQKIFGINPFMVITKPNLNNVYHIGRFAIRKEVGSINMFKSLLMCVAKLICNHTENVAFAECDRKLLRILNLLGVKTKVIGKSINYLGSETFPIIMPYEGVIDFYNENKHLIEGVLEEKQETYYDIVNQLKNISIYKV